VVAVMLKAMIVDEKSPKRPMVKPVLKAPMSQKKKETS